MLSLFYEKDYSICPLDNRENVCIIYMKILMETITLLFFRSLLDFLMVPKIVFYFYQEDWADCFEYHARMDLEWKAVEFLLVIFLECFYVLVPKKCNLKHEQSP